MRVLFIIPARGGSKGIPRKNVRILAGKPLLQYSIKNAINSTHISDVYVSSEDTEILNLASKLGAKIHHRNLDLASDEISLDEVIFNAYEEIKEIENKTYDFIVTLQATSPLLKTNSIDSAIELMINSSETETIISATNDTHLTWKKDENGFSPNYTERVNRQYLKPIYKETGGFLITRDTVISAKGRIGKSVQLFELDARQAIDIDTFEDWSLCEYFLKRKRIVFSVSGYSEIGLGHVYNTLILANEILNHEVVFFCDAKSQLAFDKISQNNYPCYMQESDNYIDDILNLQPDIVINDRLNSKVSDITPFKDKGLKVVNFEDLGEGAKHADLVFNAIYPEEVKLENHFFGPDYFCARDEFVLAKVKELNHKASNVVIAFGGVDPNNYTSKVLESINEFCIKRNIIVNVVAGFGYKYYESLNKYQNIHIHKNINNISDFMQAADIAFTSAGRTTYELAILGIPSIVLGQSVREMTHFFATEQFGFKNLGLGTEVENSSILSCFENLVNSLDERKQMREKMFSVDLRNGKKKVIEQIKNLLR